MKLELKRLTELVEYSDNPKGHAVPLIMDSISRFGYVNPIVVNETNKTILAGHGRLKALRRAYSSGTPPPKSVEMDESGDWLVPVILTHLTEDEHGAYVIADNETTIQGGWDEAKLATLLNRVSKSEQGLFATGFDKKKLAKMIESSSAKPEEVEYEIIPQPQEHYDYAMIFATNETDWVWLQETLGLARKKNVVTGDISLCRVMTTRDFAQWLRKREYAFGEVLKVMNQNLTPSVKVKRIQKAIEVLS